jgi:hypothetical protein
MRIAFLTVLSALIPLSAQSQQKVDIRRAATSTVSVRLNGALGNVRVIGWDRDSIALTGGLAAGSRLEGGPQNAPGPATGMKFYVEATDQASERGNRLELRVPKNARVWIKSGSADIEASAITGGLDLNIVGGSVRVTGTPRELIVESMDGSVVFNGTAGYARLKTATGDLSMQGGGDDISLTSISGNITVADGSAQRGRFESVTGSITYAGDVARGGEARFDTHSGAIELRFAANANAEIDAATITGTIENGLTPRRPSVGREGRGMELYTSSGTGGARVQVRSFKGNVKLSTK